MTESRSAFVPVIPAGGSGTRLWPLSRSAYPKFLLDLTGAGQSLLEATVERLAPLATAKPIVVTGVKHRDAVHEQVGSEVRILAEPTPRNSMPAIAWAAARAMLDDPDAIIGSFAADHIITPVERFHAVVNSARAAAELGYLVTIGIEPTFPATGFGYIEMSGLDSHDHDGIELSATGARPVARFVEKPDQERAEQFLSTGRFVWNAGMFVVKARVLLEALDRLQPTISQGARELAKLGDAPLDTPEALKIWESMISIAIDHALAEPLAAEGAVATVPATFDWDDIGDFQALDEQLRKANGESSAVKEYTSNESQVVILGGARVVARKASATVSAKEGRLVALVGVEGVSVIDTDAALLVIKNDQAQELSALVKSLDNEGLGDYK